VRQARARLNKTSLDSGDSSLVGSSMLALAPSRVRVVVDSGVSGELVRARETFCATGESAGMGLLSRVSADVTGLVLQPVEGLVTEGALVRTGEVLARLLLGLLLLQEGSHEAHGSSSHGR